MKSHDTRHYIKRSLRLRNPQKHVGDIAASIHREQIMRELKDAGLRGHALQSMEARHLPKIITQNEHIKGVVYGYQEVGFVMLVATARKVIFLDRKPLFMNEDEITYDVVSGVTYNHSAIGTTLTLHTRIKDYRIFCFNKNTATKFAEYIELRCLANAGRGVIL